MHLHITKNFYSNKCFVGQKMVDEADTFPGVLERVVAWLQERELGTKYKYAILTDGYVLKESGVFITFLHSELKVTLLLLLFCFRAWDMSKFLNIQCQLSRIRYPQFAKKWINIRKSYGNFYKVWIFNP